jgi:hypothetical protein
MTTSVSRFRNLDGNFRPDLVRVDVGLQPDIGCAFSNAIIRWTIASRTESHSDQTQYFVYKGQQIKVDEGGCKEAFMQDRVANLKKVQKAAQSHKKAPAKGQG